MKQQEAGDARLRKRAWGPALVGLGGIAAALVGAQGNAELARVHADNGLLVVAKAGGDVTWTESPDGIDWKSATPEGNTPLTPVSGAEAGPVVADAGGSPAGTPGRSRRGGLGPPIGVAGPLSAQLPEGEVRGPRWEHNPLPAVGTPLRLPAETVAAPRPRPVASVANSGASSELPTPQALQHSQAANPPLQVRAVERRAPTPVDAANPVSLRLTVSHPAKGAVVGETVVARMFASADCHIALIRVDTAGKVVILRSPGPSRTFACAWKAGPEAGAEYVAAVASVQPLNGADVAAALRSAGGFGAAGVEGGPEPGAAWGLVLTQAGGIGGEQKQWARHEWAVANHSFGTRPPVAEAQRPTPRPAAVRPPLEKPAAPKPEAEKKPAAPNDGSIIPTAPTPGTAEPAKVTPAPANPGTGG